jgi:predicted nucleotidyltransferase
MDASLTDVRQRQNLAEQASQTDQATKVDVLRLRDEIRAQRPQVQSVSLAFGSTAQPQATTAQDMAVVVLTLNKPMTTADKTALKRWLKVRLGRGEVQLMAQTEPAKPRHR